MNCATSITSRRLILKSITSLHRIAKDPLLWVTCVLALVYLGCASMRPDGIFWSPDEGGKYVHILSMIKTGSPSAPLEYPGRYLDREARFVPLFFCSHEGDQIYSWWPTGFPLLTLPLYMSLGWIGLYVIPAISGALCAFLAGLLVRQLRPQSSWLPVISALITGLGTPIMFYSTTFWEHTPAVACFLGSVVLVMYAWKAGHARWVFTAGLLASLATFLRTDVASMAVGVGLTLLFVRWRWAIRWGAGYIVTSLAWLFLNWLLMGQILGRYWLDTPGTLTLANASLLGGVREAGKWFIPHVLFNAPRVIAFDLGPATLTLGTSLVAIALLSPAWRHCKWVALIAYVGLAGICLSVLLHPEGYRSVHGFVLIAPHIVFSAWLYASRTAPRDSMFPSALLVVSVTTAIVYLLRAWGAAGGLQWGPRYLLALYPLLVVASLVGVAAIRESLSRFIRGSLLILYAICVLTGVGYQIRGVHAALETMRYYQQTRQAIEQLDSLPIVTNCIWLGAVIPDLYWSGSVFALHNAEPLESWTSEARRVGVRSFYLVEMDLCELITLDNVAIRRATNPSGITVERLEVSEAQ